MTLLVVYGVGAMAMALLGPSPWWLCAEYVEPGSHGDLPWWKGVGVWLGWVLAWPAVVWWLGRRAVRCVYDRLL